MILDWTNSECEEYTGEDLIFMTGAPGSKWSNVYKNLSSLKHPDLNIPTNVKTYGFRDNLIHLGPYWGPFHEYGNKFDDMDTLSKREILDELVAPYDNWDGTKVVKSHWFAYHLELIIAHFPKAKILSIYLPDNECYLWWKSLGGFDIDYPHYDWYKDDSGIIKQIAMENHKILEFSTLYNIESSIAYNVNRNIHEDNELKKYKRYTVRDILIQLGIDTDHLRIGVDITDEKKQAKARKMFKKRLSQPWISSLLYIYNPDIHEKTSLFDGQVIRFGPAFASEDIDYKDDTYELYELDKKAFDVFKPNRWKAKIREPYNLFSKGMGHEKYLEMYDRINNLNPTLVIDAGCGRNQHKPYVKNLIGFDPQPFKEADLQFTILKAPILEESADAVLCLGSLQFIDKEYVYNNLEKIVSWLKPGGLIEIRAAKKHKHLDGSVHFEWTDTLINECCDLFNLELLIEPYQYKDDWVGLNVREQGDEKIRTLWTWKKI